MQYIQLTQDKSAIVDDIDFELASAMNYFYDKQWGYARRADRSTGKFVNVFLHQEIAKEKYGDYDTSKYKIDHINRDTLDNRRDNIRLVTPSESCQNRKRFSNKEHGKYKGVHKRLNGKYWAGINFNKRSYYLGNFDNENQAAKAYNLKAKELYGEYAFLNKIEG